MFIYEDTCINLIKEKKNCLFYKINVHKSFQVYNPCNNKLVRVHLQLMIIDGKFYVVEMDELM